MNRCTRSRRPQEACQHVKADCTEEKSECTFCAEEHLSISLTAATAEDRPVFFEEEHSAPVVWQKAHQETGNEEDGYYNNEEHYASSTRSLEEI